MSGQGKAAERRAERGFILILAIGVCLMLAMIALWSSRSLQQSLRGVSAEMQAARAEALADGGAEIAALRLAGGSAGAAAGLPNPGGIYHACRVDGAGHLVIKVEDEGGKVALNSPNAALLQALFIGLGAAEDQARSYAARIADYRDPDDDRRPDGAEQDDYRDAASGATGGPKNADFETVDELDRVMGIPAGLRERAKPWLTAEGQATGVDPQTADPVLVDLLVRGSTSALGGGFGGADGEGEDLPAALRSPSSRTAFTVRAIAVIADSGAIFVREAILGVTGRGAAGSRWRDWKQGVLRPDETVPRADGAMPAC